MKYLKNDINSKEKRALVLLNLEEQTDEEDISKSIENSTTEDLNRIASLLDLPLLTFKDLETEEEFLTWMANISEKILTLYENKE